MEGAFNPQTHREDFKRAVSEVERQLGNAHDAAIIEDKERDNQDVEDLRWLHDQKICEMRFDSSKNVAPADEYKIALDSEPERSKYRELPISLQEVKEDIKIGRCRTIKLNDKNMICPACFVTDTRLAGKRRDETLEKEPEEVKRFMAVLMKTSLN